MVVSSLRLMLVRQEDAIFTWVGTSDLACVLLKVLVPLVPPHFESNVRPVRTDRSEDNKNIEKNTRSRNRAIAQTHQPMNKDYDISRFPLPFEGDRCLVFLIKPIGSTTPLSTWYDLHLLHKQVGSGSWPSPNLRHIYLQESSTQYN